MPTFQELGIQVQHTFQTSSMSAGSVQLTSKQTTKVTLTLPRPSPISASFRKESWGDSVVKVFKKELQTGDKEFDDLVYVSTDSPEATAAFLQKPEIRRAIGLCIETGGPLEIEGTRMVGTIVGHDKKEDPDLVTIAAALLAT